MDVKSAFMSGVQGYQNALNNAASASQAINKPQQASASQNGLLSDSLTSNLLQLKQAELSGQASARVIKSADEMLGTVIDIRV